MKFSMKRALVVFSLAAVCLPSGALLWAQDAADASKEAPAPMFKAEKYKEAFEKGKKEFAAGEYKDASKSFKKSLSGGKEKADKVLVNKWILACKGSATLRKIEVMRQRNLWNEAYDQFIIAFERYGETPLRGSMLKLYANLEGTLFLNLENFNYTNTRDYSQKYGKSFIKDPRYLTNGTQCLRWQNTTDGKPGMLKLNNVPSNWSGFKSVEFYIFVYERANLEAVIMSSGGKKKAGGAPTAAPAGQAVQTSFLSKVLLQNTKQWQLVRLNLSSFKSQGGASLESVKDFRLQVPRGGRKFDFLIDEIRLRKKNPKQATGGSRKR